MYNANTTTARPESYRQDMKALSSITNETERRRLFKCISSIAESGWDFSSRWFKNQNDLLSTIMDEIIPTDLNSIMAVNEAYLVKLAEKYKRMDLQTYYLKCLKERREYFVMIRSSDGRYPDYKEIE
jgi:alpha,alpha-trehalase